MLPTVGRASVGNRLQDLLADEPIDVTVHPDFAWWLEEQPEPGSELATTLERANAAVMPTARLADLAGEPRTMVFFEAPHRLAEMLAALAEAFGPDRSSAVCRELTKTYEEVRRGPLAELAPWAQEHTRGEITVVVAGAAPRAVGVEEALPAVQARVRDGERLKDACAAVSAQTGVAKKALYDAAVARR